MDEKPFNGRIEPPPWKKVSAAEYLAQGEKAAATTSVSAAEALALVAEASAEAKTPAKPQAEGRI